MLLTKKILASNKDKDNTQFYWYLAETDLSIIKATLKLWHVLPV